MSVMRTKTIASVVRACVLALAISLVAVAPALGDVTVGGGSWDYGASKTLGKHAWSNYKHPTKKHSSTSVCGGEVDMNGVIAAGWWSYAESWCGLFDSTAAYWSVY